MHKSIYYKLHTDGFATALAHTGDDKKVKSLFYATVHCLMMGHWATKYVAADVLKHECDSDELCAFVGFHCGN